MKNRKGFTLIELLAVIVILAIIALIAVPKILNMIEDARKSSVKDSAYGYVKSIENKIAQSSLKGITYEDKEDYAYEDIKVDMKGTKPTYVRYSLKKGMVESGVFCIDDYIVNYTNKEVTVGGRCNEDELKLPGNVEISVSSGNYTYPNSGKFKVTTNISGGTLSCTTSDKEVATCSISGDEVTVTPGIKEGQADITVKSAATSKHKEAQAVHVAITAKGTIPSVTATGYEGIYDGEEHGITVSTTLDGATIKYGEKNETYDKDVSPKYSEVGTYTVYYQITKEGYTTITGNKDVVINKAEGNVTAPSAKTLTYTGSDQTLINAGSSSTGTIQYKLNDGTYSTNLPSATNAGTYTVYYRVLESTNYSAVLEKSINVTIGKKEGNVTAPTAKILISTGNEQTLINAGSSNTGTIQYKLGSNGTYSTNLPSATNAGTYTVYYRVLESTNYSAVSEKSISVTIVNASCSTTMNTTNWATSKIATITGTGLGNGISLQYKVESGSTIKTDWTTISSGTTKTIDWNANPTTPTKIYCRIVTDTTKVDGTTYIENKIDNVAPTLTMATGNYNLTDTNYVYTASFGSSSGNVSCVNTSRGNEAVTTFKSINTFGSNSIKCTATSNAGKSVSKTVTYNMGHNIVGSEFPILNGGQISGTSIIVPPGSIQFGPYLPINAGCYQVWYFGNNLDAYPNGYRAYDFQNGEINFQVLSLNYVSKDSNYYVKIPSNYNKMEFVLENHSSSSITIDNIVIKYIGDVSVCPNS